MSTKKYGSNTILVPKLYQKFVFYPKILKNNNKKKNSSLNFIKNFFSSLETKIWIINALFFNSLEMKNKLLVKFKCINKLKKKNPIV